MAPLPPKVAVVMATYNWSEVLPYSIGSALAPGSTNIMAVNPGPLLSSFRRGCGTGFRISARPTP